MAQSNNSRREDAEEDIQAARAEFELLGEEAREIVGTWWKKWYGKTGHRPLARTLIGTYPDQGDETS